MSMNFLKRLAYEFYEGLDFVSRKKQYGRLTVFGGFPNGCCRYASDLLAEYMIDNGIARERIQMVEGETKEKGYTHCWLMIDDTFYVDITAGQFNGKSYFKEYQPIESSCVVPKDTYLYECFDNKKMQYIRNVGINSYSYDTPFKLKVIYEAVIQYHKNK